MLLLKRLPLWVSMLHSVELLEVYLRELVFDNCYCAFI
jgi:hypothetical protein